MFKVQRAIAIQIGGLMVVGIALVFSFAQLSGSRDRGRGAAAGYAMGRLERDLLSGFVCLLQRASFASGRPEYWSGLFSSASGGDFSSPWRETWPARQWHFLSAAG